MAAEIDLIGAPNRGVDRTAGSVRDLHLGHARREPSSVMKNSQIPDGLVESYRNWIDHRQGDGLPASDILSVLQGLTMPQFDPPAGADLDRHVATAVHPDEEARFKP